MINSKFRRAFFMVCCAVGAVLAVWRTFILKDYYNFTTTDFDVAADAPLTAMKYILFALAAVVFCVSVIFGQKLKKSDVGFNKNYIADIGTKKSYYIIFVVCAVTIQAASVIIFANIGDALTLRAEYAKMPTMSVIYSLSVILTAILSEAYVASLIIGAITKKKPDASGCVLPIIILIANAVGSQLNPYYTLRNSNRIIINIAVVCVLLCCLADMRSRVGRGLYSAHFGIGCFAAVVGIPAFVPEIIFLIIKSSVKLSEACDVIMFVIFIGEMITMCKMTGLQPKACEAQAENPEVQNEN